MSRPIDIDVTYEEYVEREGLAQLARRPAVQLIDTGLEQIPLFTPGGIRETSSGTVVLYKPNDAMRVIHQRANDMIYPPIDGFFSGYTGNAVGLARAGCKYIYEIDLLDAYGSVRPEHIALRCMPYYVDCSSYSFGDTEALVRDMLQKYFFMLNGGLVQGGPASPRLFELAARHRLDWDLNGLLNQWRANNNTAGRAQYYRYADNLVLGTKDQPLTGDQKRQIREVIRAAGFTINPKKTRSIVLRKQSVTVCGVGMRMASGGVKVFMPRSQLRRLEGMLHLVNTGRAVDMNQVHGLMGVFFQTTNPKRMNATERRVLAAYRKFQKEKNVWQKSSRPIF